MTGCSGDSTVSPVSTRMQQVYQALGFDDKNHDGVIKKKGCWGLCDAGEGYKPEADIDSDGILVGTEIRYYLHFVASGVDERIKQANPLNDEDRDTLAKMFFDKARKLDAVAAKSATIINESSLSQDKDKAAAIWRDLKKKGYIDGDGKIQSTFLVDSRKSDSTNYIWSYDGGLQYNLASIRIDMEWQHRKIQTEILGVALSAAKASLFSEAMEIVNSHDDSADPKTICEIIELLVKAKEFSRAFELLRKLSSFAVREVLDSSVQKYWIKVAESTLNELKNSGLDKEQLSFRFKQLVDMIPPFYWNVSASDENIWVIFVANFIEYLPKSGLSHAQLKDIFGLIIDKLFNNSGKGELLPYNKGKIFSSYMKSVMAIGLDWEALYPILVKAVAIINKTELPLNILTFNIERVVKKEFGFEKYLALIELVEDENECSFKLLQLFKDAIEAKQSKSQLSILLDKELERVRRFKDSSIKTRAIEDFAIVWDKNGLGNDRARILLEEAVKIARREDDIPKKARNICDVVTTMWKLRIEPRNQLRQLLEEALNTARGEKDVSQRAKIIDDVVAKMLELKINPSSRLKQALEEALSAARAETNVLEKAKSIYDVSSVMWKYHMLNLSQFGGLLQEALNTARSFKVTDRDDKPKYIKKASILSKIAVGLKKAGTSKDQILLIFTEAMQAMQDMIPLHFSSQGRQRREESDMLNWFIDEAYTQIANNMQEAGFNRQEIVRLFQQKALGVALREERFQYLLRDIK